MFSAAPYAGVQLENSGVMLPKFLSDPVTRHKWEAMSVTLGWV